MPGLTGVFQFPFPVRGDSAKAIPGQIQSLAEKVDAALAQRAVAPDLETAAALATRVTSVETRTTALENKTGAWAALPLANGATIFGGTYRAPQYRKVGDRVELRGLVGTPPANNTNFALLPAGFRPLETEVLNTVTQTVAGQLYIYPDGRIARGDGTGTYITLGALAFSVL